MIAAILRSADTAIATKATFGCLIRTRAPIPLRDRHCELQWPAHEQARPWAKWREINPALRDRALEEGFHPAFAKPQALHRASRRELHRL